MSLSADITLDKKDGTDVVFSFNRWTVDGSVRLDSTSTLALPHQLTIKHSQAGPKGLVADRHLIQVVKAVDCSGIRKDVIINLTISVPQDPAVTTAIVKDSVHLIADLIVDGAIASSSTMDNVGAIILGGS